MENSKLPASVQMVKQFHDLFEHPIGRVIGQEPLNIRQLRVKLLFEELVELAEAGDVRQTMAVLSSQYLQKVNARIVIEKDQTQNITFELPPDGNNVDSVEEADALADLQYVLDGKKLTSGLYLYMDAIFERVHMNNMNKAHRTEDHANETMDKKPEEAPFTKALRGDRWFLYNKDGKLTKPWDHMKVSIAPLLPL